MQMLSESPAKETVRALELHNLPAVGFRFMSTHKSIYITIRRHHQAHNANVFSCRAQGSGSVLEHVELFCYCFQLQMEHQFILTEGVIINQTPQRTVVSGYFIQQQLL